MTHPALDALHPAERARVRRAGPPDLPTLDDADLTEVPLRGRKRVLRRSLTRADPIRFAAHRNGDGERYLDYACAHGWERLIAKRADSPHRPGRTKDRLTFPCALVGYHPAARDGRHPRYLGLRDDKPATEVVREG